MGALTGALASRENYGVPHHVAQKTGLGLGVGEVQGLIFALNFVCRITQ